MFTLTQTQDTNISFQNDVPYTEDFNTYTYRNFYNGGGVAIGDINNDGLSDIYFTGNLVDNKLYLNKGNWEFDDITPKAGVACPGVWSTGVTMVDINGDGWLDIYVCKAGKPDGDNRHNELFINNQDLTFTEKSKEYGLDITGLSIHSSFFDYDRDGDLDCYILNNSLRSVGGFDLTEGQREVPDVEGNKLMRNDGGLFIDVSTNTGIFSSKIGYGLGITFSDFNDDNYPDIFISNDFFEKDYLYINNKKGGFSERGDTSFTSLSMGSMGADACDLDNDLKPDLFVTEMLPRDHKRKKIKNQYETWDKYISSVENGFHHQYSRNSLHKNLGSAQFLEISRFSGVADTEWSWASLAQDYDNDGFKDLFVSNGIYKDLLDKDYLNYSANTTMIKSKIDKNEKVLTMLIDSMPSQPVKNCMFRNTGNLKFQMVSDEWGFEQETFSNGSAYGDLDNDGDLDLVVNNVNMPSFVYKNNSDTAISKSIRFNLVGTSGNTKAIGAKVTIKTKEYQAMFENYPSRGFQSCIEPIVHFGVGMISTIDTTTVIWPSGKKSVHLGLQVGNTHTLLEKDAGYYTPTHPDNNKCCIDSPFDFTHEDTDINLFTRERLLIEMNGFDGPAVAIADLNGDNMDDVFCGGGKNQKSILYLSEGSKYISIELPFDLDYRSEVVKARFFDSDNDGDKDLYVAHGGILFSEFAPELHDVLYINQGNGSFIKGEKLPFKNPICTGDIEVLDINNDGLSDIVIVEKCKSSIFGTKGDINFLYNKGNNQWKFESPSALMNIGMMTSVVTLDADKDGYKDLMIAGKWMDLTLLVNKKGSFMESIPQRIPNSAGLWNVLVATDIDDDKDMDIFCGNVGLNTFYQPNMKMMVDDFDKNGSVEQIICYVDQDKYYPVHDIDEMFSQMPYLKKKYLSYASFANADINMLFTEPFVKNATTFTLQELRSCLLINDNGNFHLKSLPDEIQYSSVYTIIPNKISKINRIYFGGNHNKIKPQAGRQDASLGWSMDLIIKNQDITFQKPKPLYIHGQIRSMNVWNDQLLVGINGEKLKIYQTGK